MLWILQFFLFYFFFLRNILFKKWFLTLFLQQNLLFLLNHFIQAKIFNTFLILSLINLCLIKPQNFITFQLLYCFLSLLKKKTLIHRFLDLIMSTVNLFLITLHSSWVCYNIHYILEIYCLGSFNFYHFVYKSLVIIYPAFFTIHLHFKSLHICWFICETLFLRALNQILLEYWIVCWLFSLSF